MDTRQSRRTQQTRERIRTAAQRLFLQHGYMATSIDAILAEAGISSKETLYRHYTNKEELFAAVLKHLTMEQPAFSQKLAALPTPHDLPSLRQALTTLAREILSLMGQPEYLALVRMIIAEASRFPQLGPLFFSTVPQRGLTIITAMLQAAREQRIIVDMDYDAVARALLGGLLSYGIANMLFVGEGLQLPAPERADAIIEVIIRALTPR